MVNTGGITPRMRQYLLAAALSLVSPTAIASVETEPKVIYGPDNRQEVFTLRGARATAADSTAALVPSSSITDNGNSTSQVSTRPYTVVPVQAGTTLVGVGLCPSERFFGQPTAPFCSGALVAPDVIATAGHCISGADSLASTRFVFGFRLTNVTTVRTTFPNDDIYRGVQLLAWQQIVSVADFALVRLDRPVAGRTPLRLASGGPPPVGTPLYVIGYPTALPEKIADGAGVIRQASATSFQANLDTYEGNSGSPVFNARNNLLVGLLDTGAPDYVLQGNCAVSNRLPDPSGQENVINANAFAPFVPLR